MQKSKLTIQEYEKEKYKYQTFVRVGDLNYGNHLAHDKLITIVHDARVSFLKAHQLQEINIENTFSLLVSTLSVQYLSQAYLGELLCISIFIDEIKNTYFQMKYKISRTKTPIALCATHLVCYNQIKKRPDKIPASLLSVLTP